MSTEIKYETNETFSPDFYFELCAGVLCLIIGIILLFNNNLILAFIPFIFIAVCSLPIVVFTFLFRIPKKVGYYNSNMIMVMRYSNTPIFFPIQEIKWLRSSANISTRYHGAIKFKDHFIPFSMENHLVHEIKCQFYQITGEYPPSPSIT